MQSSVQQSHQQACASAQYQSARADADLSAMPLDSGFPSMAVANFFKKFLPNKLAPTATSPKNGFL